MIGSETSEQNKTTKGFGQLLVHNLTWSLGSRDGFQRYQREHKCKSDVVVHCSDSHFGGDRTVADLAFEVFLQGKGIQSSLAHFLTLAQKLV